MNSKTLKMKAITALVLMLATVLSFSFAGAAYADEANGVVAKVTFDLNGHTIDLGSQGQFMDFGDYKTLHLISSGAVGTIKNGRDVDLSGE